MMPSLRWFLLSLPLLLAGCSPADDSASDTVDPAVAKAQAERIDAMRGAIASLLAGPEIGDEEIEVQHVLIGFKGSTNPTDATRSNAEAEALAADVYARALKGEDMTALMKEYSDDPGGGIYPMTKAGRGGMVAGFGNVGFRLLPGMIGVSPFHPTDSPYGWHVIKRLK